jgi:hypothetical protein
MRKILKNIAFVIGLFSVIFVGCKDDIDPIVEELDFNRVFSPTELTARIRNMTTVELSWEVRPDASSYVVEISEDSLVFGNIIASVTVKPDEIPFSYKLEGETRYSARIKGVVEGGIEDSKWAAIVFRTDAENILFPLEGEDITATTVMIKWPAGEEATNFIINPGNVNRPITAEEIAAGEATITDLAGETDYTVTMMKNSKQRGQATFKTLVDLGGATALYPEDDLNEIFTNAGEGDKFVLYPGDYTVYTGVIILNKSISIKGLYPYDMPIVHAQFEIEDGAQTVEITNIELTGSYLDEGSESTLDYAIRFNSENVAYGSLSVSGSKIYNFNKSFIITQTSSACSVESILVDNCIVSDIYNDGGDFLDYRLSYIGNLTITNSTFINCATVNTRDFIRMDGESKGNTYDDGTRTPEIEVSNCTFYNVMNSESSMKRLFYVRWTQHTIKSSNNLMAEMGVSVYTNQSLTLQPECTYNNYFNAVGYFTEAENVKIDNSSNYTTLDPGFADPENGNFTVTNQTLLDNRVGDPRWLGN